MQKLWNNLIDKPNIIILLLTFSLIVLGIYLYQANLSISNKVDFVNSQFHKYTLCNEDIKTELSKQSNIFESLIRQQERDINFILLYIPLLFAIFTGVSYITFLEKAERLKEDIKQQYEIEKQKIEEMGHELSSSQIQLYQEIGQMRDANAHRYLLINDYTNYLKNKLQGLSYFSSNYLYEKHIQNINNLQECKDFMIKILKEIITECKKNEIEIEKDFLFKESNQIRKTEDNDIIEILLEIEKQVKLK